MFVTETISRALRVRRHRPTSMVEKLVWIVFGLALLVVISEGFLRLFPGVGLSPSARRERAWRASHRSTGEVVTRARHSFDTHSPELGWELKPNLRSTHLNSNSRGLRGIREYDVRPKPGVRRVLAVGDSFMFGENLTDEQTFSAQLEQLLNRQGKWQVLNLGVHGYGTDQQWLRLRRLGFEFGGEIVVLGFFEENLRRNTMSFRDYAKPYFELIEGELVLRNVPVPSPKELLAAPLEEYACGLYLWCALDSLSQNFMLSFPWTPLEYTRAGRVTLALLDTIRKESVSRGMQVLLLSIPRELRSKPSKVETLLSGWAARTQTPSLNLREAFLEFPAEDRTKLYAGHWTAYGARAAAELAAEKIRGITFANN